MRDPFRPSFRERLRAGAWWLVWVGLGLLMVGLGWLVLAFQVEAARQLLEVLR